MWVGKLRVTQASVLQRLPPNREDFAFGIIPWSCKRPLKEIHFSPVLSSSFPQPWDVAVFILIGAAA